MAYYAVPEQFLGRLAIERDTLDVRMLLKENVKIIHNSRFLTDVGVHAAGPDRCLQHVPDRDFVAQKACASLLVIARGTEDLPHDRPEDILWMRVILLI